MLHSYYVDEVREVTLTNVLAGLAGASEPLRSAYETAERILGSDDEEFTSDPLEPPAG